MLKNILPATMILGLFCLPANATISGNSSAAAVASPATPLATTLFNASAATLPHWRAALSRVMSGTGNATLYFGPTDSTMCGYNSNVSPNPFLASPPAILAAMFTAQGINTNFETKLGFQSVADPRYSTASWSLGSPYTIGGNDNLYATSASAGSITFTPSTNTDTFKIFYYSGGAAGVGSYSIDGGTAIQFAVSATRGVYTATSPTVALGSHTIAINWISGVVGYAGVQAYDSSKKQLFIVDGCYPGSNTANWNTTTGAQNGIQTLTYLNQDLTVNDLGINDWGQGVSIATYTGNLQALITQEKTVGDVLLVTSIPSNPGVAVSTGTAPSNAVQQTYAAAEYSLAAANNISIVDEFGMFGSYATESPYGYYNGDGVHPLPIAIADEVGQIYRALDYSAARTPSVLGPVTLPSVTITGTKFTATGCSVSATIGGATAGTYTSGTAGSCTTVITMNGAAGGMSPNGWACSASDRTTPANIIMQTASTTTTATLSGITASGDVISFQCMGY